MDTTELAARLPLLRARLEEQREFRISQLVDLAAEELEYEERVQAGIPVAPAKRELSALLTSAARRALADIEGALERIATGRYGTCVSCAAPIELARLAAVPQAPFCAPCQRGADLR